MATKTLPAHTLDTMSEAIAMSSPSGRQSKRAHDAATRRLSLALFGPDGLQGPIVEQPTEKTALLQQVARLRDLANRGMSVQKFNREADRLEAQAAGLED